MSALGLSANSQYKYSLFLFILIISTLAFMRFSLFSSSALLLNAHRLGAWVLPLNTILGTGDTLNYLLTEHYVGHDFLDKFQWETLNDPTHGRVNYVGKEEAIAKNLTYVTERKFVMRADAVNDVQPESRGRDSVRIISNADYAEYVLILSLAHMPEGCATWPAFWTVSKNGPWPGGGEIDIIEGVNNNENNLSSLHTNPNCTQSVFRQQSGRTTTTNCDATTNYNIGCGVEFTRQNSFGSSFNANGGGTYTLRRSLNGIDIWFWPKTDPSAPQMTTNGEYLQQLSVAQWGTPDAHFGYETCDYKSHFDSHRMIFDLAFCGDWAGSAFSSSGCGAGSCETFVNTQPLAFQKAFWEVDYLLIYTPQF